MQRIVVIGGVAAGLKAAAKVRSEQPGKSEEAAAPTCPGCARTVRPGAVFCPQCGRRQAAAK